MTSFWEMLETTPDSREFILHFDDDEGPNPWAMEVISRKRIASPTGFSTDLKHAIVEKVIDKVEGRQNVYTRGARFNQYRNLFDEHGYMSPEFRESLIKDKP